MQMETMVIADIVQSTVVLLTEVHNSCLGHAGVVIR